MRQDIHGATYWLNSTFQYDNDWFFQSSDVMSGLLAIFSTSHEATIHQKLVNEKLFLETIWATLQLNLQLIHAKLQE